MPNCLSFLRVSRKFTLSASVPHYRSRCSLPSRSPGSTPVLRFLSNTKRTHEIKAQICCFIDLYKLRQPSCSEQAHNVFKSSEGLVCLQRQLLVWPWWFHNSGRYTPAENLLKFMSCFRPTWFVAKIWRRQVFMTSTVSQEQHSFSFFVFLRQQVMKTFQSYWWMCFSFVGILLNLSQ